nr:unnamed protein product [Digitaria exilis]
MRRRVLEDLSKEEDVESSTRKLVDQGKWLPTLRTLVSKINDTFSHEHGVDFDHYGILIKVKFR